MRRFAILAAVALLGAAALVLAVETVQVTVMQTAVRKDKHFYSPAVAMAQLREVLTLLGKEGEWLRVKKGATEGWIHVSATAGKAPEAKGGGRSAANVSQDEATLAGKGFNPQVEGEYKKRNPKLDFGAVDRLQSLTAPERELEQFARAGNLQPKEEGR